MHVYVHINKDLCVILRWTQEESISRLKIYIKSVYIVECVAVCCNVWQRIALLCSALLKDVVYVSLKVLQCVAMCDSVLQCIVVRCSVLPKVAMHH